VFSYLARQLLCYAAMGQCCEQGKVASTFVSKKFRNELTGAPTLNLRYVIDPPSGKYAKRTYCSAV
jgi:hypothetical protein